eukprot:CAMPEP_0171455680 /NCGR_PEP_ID=MMETSP0945-20130129/2480_1 /TAXON_ID=109269 /ORGANISM="Vaucheria litorea, Strain CCMP2940" /LENGTH=201 /DNA_ID=CAMNT_0011980973 /DNA_START=81 /DNA_END=686 /DNA_ORIENTATION=+
MKVQSALAAVVASAHAISASGQTTVDPKTFGVLEVLQVTGALSPNDINIGGIATAETRSMYIFSLDKPDVISTTECSYPEYQGGGHPLVYVDGEVTLGTGIKAGLCGGYTIAGLEADAPVLCCNVNGYGLMPMYQYGDEAGANTVGGIDGNWYTVDGQGGSTAPGSEPAVDTGMTPEQPSSGQSLMVSAATVLASIAALLA